MNDEGAKTQLTPQSTVVTFRVIALWILLFTMPLLAGIVLPILLAILSLHPDPPKYTAKSEWHEMVLSAKTTGADAVEIPGSLGDEWILISFHPVGWTEQVRSLIPGPDLHAIDQYLNWSWVEMPQDLVARVREGQLIETTHAGPFRVRWDPLVIPAGSVRRVNMRSESEWTFEAVDADP